MAVLDRALMQPRLGHAMIALPHAHNRDETGIAEHIDRRVGQFERATVGIGIHRGELFLRHLLHPHPRRMEGERSEEHTSELQSLMRISYAVFCLKKKK